MRAGATGAVLAECATTRAQSKVDARAQGQVKKIGGDEPNTTEGGAIGAGMAASSGQARAMRDKNAILERPLPSRAGPLTCRPPSRPKPRLAQEIDRSLDYAQAAPDTPPPDFASREAAQCCSIESRSIQPKQGFNNEEHTQEAGMRLRVAVQVHWRSQEGRGRAGAKRSHGRRCARSRRRQQEGRCDSGLRVPRGAFALERW